MEMKVELPGGGMETEIVARALYAYNNFPGRDPMDCPWPPTNRSTLMKYWNQACAVIKAQHSKIT